MYGDVACAALGFDAVEDGILNNGLQRKAVDALFKEKFIICNIIQFNGSAVAVFHNGKIVIHQRELITYGDKIFSVLCDVFHQAGKRSGHVGYSLRALNGCHPFDGV